MQIRHLIKKMMMDFATELLHKGHLKSETTCGDLVYLCEKTLDKRTDWEKSLYPECKELCNSMENPDANNP